MTWSDGSVNAGDVYEGNNKTFSKIDPIFDQNHFTSFSAILTVIQL
jgi:hypothetical protein